MNFWELLLIGISLSMDCFAVSLGIGCSRKIFSLSITIRVAIVFGIAQGLMLFSGWLIGQSVVNIISTYATWIVFLLLSAIGLHMIWESFHDDDEEKTDLSKGIALLTVAILTSIDSLGAGLALAFQHVHITTAILIVGTTTFVITIIGFLIGNKVAKLLGKWAELLGGLILIGIGLKILIEHLIG